MRQGSLEGSDEGEEVDIQMSLPSIQRSTICDAAQRVKSAGIEDETIDAPVVGYSVGYGICQGFLICAGEAADIRRQQRRGSKGD